LNPKEKKKMKSIRLFVVLIAVLIVSVACGGNPTDDWTEIETNYFTLKIPDTYMVMSKSERRLLVGAVGNSPFTYLDITYGFNVEEERVGSISERTSRSITICTETEYQETTFAGYKALRCKYQEEYGNGEDDVTIVTYDMIVVPLNGTHIDITMSYVNEEDGDDMYQLLDTLVVTNTDYMK